MKHKISWMMALVLALVLALLLVHPAYADTITVTTTNDVLDAAYICGEVTIGSLPGSDGETSLREAICAANNNPDPDTIEFHISIISYCYANGVCVIQRTSPLPALTDDWTTIDGYTQPAAAEATDTTLAALKIVIDGAGVGSSGLYIASANNVVKGLVIKRFSPYGVRIQGSGATGNTVSGNYIGTSYGGIVGEGNAQGGVFIVYGDHNIIGGDTPAARNIISGNGGHGVDIVYSTDNTISGNYIGIDASGTATLGNTENGVCIFGGANNIIGGDTPAARNVISGNGENGVYILGGSEYNTVSHNYIGTNVNGTAELGNAEDGVRIGTKNNTVGPRNIISGNDGNGVYLANSAAEDNTVSGNYIGTDASGTTALGNGSSGVLIERGDHNTVGRIGNIISGNDGHGICIHESISNTISSNYIGTDVNGTAELGNNQNGVSIAIGGRLNTIVYNLISANDGDGVTIVQGPYSSKTTIDNTVSGNYIGTDAAGMKGLGNGQSGVYIGDAHQTNVTRNIISGNGWDGVGIDGDSFRNIVFGNYIGTDASGTAALGNAFQGVHIKDGAHDNTVGGTLAGERNVISGNGRSGIRIHGNHSTGNIVSGNYIGTDASGTADLGNARDGVKIRVDAQNNIVGGDTASERNVISGNDGHGVSISGSDTTGNVISGNYIGTDVNGTAELGNAADGVCIEYGAYNNVIGGDTTDERNIISGNGLGIGIYSSYSNTVSGNYVGADVNGTAALGNLSGGVHLGSGAHDNTIGGEADGRRNVISGNLGGAGVEIYGDDTRDNIVVGNYIGAGADGTSSLGNAFQGVHIVFGAHDNLIGPGNLIAYNSEDGVAVVGSSSTNNTITQNSIFANRKGIHLTNGANGDIAAPVIAATTSGSVNIIGTACSFCIVELFENNDTDGEGETFVGAITAGDTGNFIVTVDYLSKPYLTATATDSYFGRTSEFSAVFFATVPPSPPTLPTYLPLILNNH